jgi:hypothetical protein
VTRLEFRCLTHVRRLQVLQSKCFRLVTGGPWSLRNKQIHDDLGFPLFADHIRALTAKFGSNIGDTGDSCFGNSADTYADQGLTPLPDSKAKIGGGQQAS